MYFVKYIHFKREKNTVCRTFEMTHVIYSTTLTRICGSRYHVFQNHGHRNLPNGSLKSHFNSHPIHPTLKNERPTWRHLLFYFTSYVLNMFRTLIYPSSGAGDCVVELPHRPSCSQLVLQAEAQVVLQPAKRTPPKTSHTKSPTHNELRTRRPMW